MYSKELNHYSFCQLPKPTLFRQKFKTTHERLLALTSPESQILKDTTHFVLSHPAEVVKLKRFCYTLAMTTSRMSWSPMASAVMRHSGSIVGCIYHRERIILDNLDDQ